MEVVKVKRKRPYDRSVFQALTLISQFGINMLVPIGLMTFLGVLEKQYSFFVFAA